MEVKLAFICSSKNFTSTRMRNALVKMEVYPNHMVMDIWVEASNSLGMVESEHLIMESDWFGEFASLLLSKGADLILGCYRDLNWINDFLCPQAGRLT